VLFQIVDDILDVAGEEVMLGKAVGGDARLGKATYVSFHGLDRARELAAETHSRARALLDGLPGSHEDLLHLADHVYTRRH